MIRRGALARWPGLGIAAAVAASVAPGCSLGDGTGSVSGVLDVPGCWSGAFDLKPDFFAAVPSATSTPGSSQSGEPGSDALLLRIQNGGDYETFSDGLSVLVDDAGEVRGDPLNGASRPSLLGEPLVVSLPVGVAPAGTLITPQATPPIVHATLYLDKTCRTQDVALYAMSQVSLEPDGTCDRPDGGDAPLPCPAGAASTSDGGGAATADASTQDAAAASTQADAAAAAGDGGAPKVATSTMTFDSLFDGNPDESDAQQRLTNATFDLYLADPREICPGGLGPPPRCRGHLTGYFKFYFERGRPAQPFP